MNKTPTKAKAPFRLLATWVRLAFMLLFGIVYGLLQYLVFVVAIAQGVVSLFKKTPDQSLQKFGAGLAEYTYRIVSFLTFNTNIKPFPFDDWRDGSGSDSDLRDRQSAPASSHSKTRQTPSASTRKKTTGSGARATGGKPSGTADKKA